MAEAIRCSWVMIVSGRTAPPAMIEGDDDVVPLFEVAFVQAHLLHDPDGLMSENRAFLDARHRVASEQVLPA